MKDGKKQKTEGSKRSKERKEGMNDAKIEERDDKKEAIKGRKEGK